MEKTFDKMRTTDDIRCQSPVQFPSWGRKRSDELLHGSWGMRSRWGPWSDGLLFTGWCIVPDARANFSLSVHACRHRQIRVAMFKRARAANDGDTELFRQPWWMILPMSDSAANRKSVFWERLEWPRRFMSGSTGKGKDGFILTWEYSVTAYRYSPQDSQNTTTELWTLNETANCVKMDQDGF